MSAGDRKTPRMPSSQAPPEPVRMFSIRARDALSVPLSGGRRRPRPAPSWARAVSLLPGPPIVVPGVKCILPSPAGIIAKPVALGGSSCGHASPPQTYSALWTCFPYRVLPLWKCCPYGRAPRGRASPVEYSPSGCPPPTNLLPLWTCSPLWTAPPHGCAPPLSAPLMNVLPTNVLPLRPCCPHRSRTLTTVHLWPLCCGRCSHLTCPGRLPPPPAGRALPSLREQPPPG